MRRSANTSGSGPWWMRPAPSHAKGSHAIVWPGLSFGALRSRKLGMLGAQFALAGQPQVQTTTPQN